MDDIKKKNVLFITNLPSPYRVDFFNELGKSCSLTVVYERKRASDRNEKWLSNISEFNFNQIYANLTPVGAEASKGNDLVKIIKYSKFDYLFITNYASQAVMKVIFYCQIKKIPYFVEHDGGLLKKDKFFVKVMKKLLLKKAKKHFTTSDVHKKYLKSLGIKEENILKYPFSSVRKTEVTKVDFEEKQIEKEALGVKGKKVVLSVGSYIYGKGFDVLIDIAGNDHLKDYDFYFVGGVPTKEYLKKQKEHNLKNVHFIDFMTKEELSHYYKMADLFVLPTRSDVWGLVINEAMSYGLPVITTDMCCAGLEMIEDGINGFIVPVDNKKILSEKIDFIMENDEIRTTMGENNIKKIKNYTIESMSNYHYDFLAGMDK